MDRRIKRKHEKKATLNFLVLQLDVNKIQLEKSVETLSSQLALVDAVQARLDLEIAQKAENERVARDEAERLHADGRRLADELDAARRRHRQLELEAAEAGAKLAAQVDQHKAYVEQMDAKFETVSVRTSWVVTPRSADGRQLSIDFLPSIFQVERAAEKESHAHLAALKDETEAKLKAMAVNTSGSLHILWIVFQTQ